MSGTDKRISAIFHLLENQPWAELVRQDIETGLRTSPIKCQVEFFDPHGDSRAQVQLMEQQLQSRPDLLVLLPINGEACKPVLEKFKQSQIPVIILDNDIGEPDLYQTLILADNRQFGRRVGEFFIEAAEAEAKIVEIAGIRTTTGAIDRSAGFREAIAGRPGIEIIDSISGEWLYDAAYSGFKRALANHPQIDGVFAQSDEMARAAYDAAVEAGREEQMLITGIDALKIENGGIRMVLAGKFAATFINPSPGKEAVEALVKILGGGTVTKKNLLYTSPMKSNEKITRWKEARKLKPA